MYEGDPHHEWSNQGYVLLLKMSKKKRGSNTGQEVMADAQRGMQDDGVRGIDGIVIDVT